MKKIIVMLLLPMVFLSCISVSGLQIPTTRTKPGLDERTIIAGLKEALNIGTKNAVKYVSRTDGYFKNVRIKIPMPKELSDVDKVLRRFGLGKKVDEFVETMNRGAEKAAPEAVDIFVDAISQMTVSDGIGILRGADNAATRYFENKTRSRLYNVFLPIVKKVLDKVGVTSLYKFIVEAYNKFSGGKRISFDIDAYVTNKALDGLFIMVGDEEKKIRKDPAARVTDLLRKVFG
ncbi:MAG: DUF4197 domain-containing protein [Spirochaetales bacterium]|nr:DUF4197 domain-containing protein [Spirochaetales bacterium]